MSAFTLKAEGGTNAADPSEIRRALSILLFERHELRRLPGGRCQAVSRDDLDSAVKVAEEMSDGQVYWSLNPIKPGCDRANKRDVACRRWLLVDVDTIRPTVDVSSTDAEKASACSVAQRVADYLLDAGWPAPLMIDSGNGWHLLYRVDLPNDPLSQQIIKGVLYRLAEGFDCAEAVIDRATHDAPRISKLPGTMARKGIATPERPHRMARLVYEPDRLETVTVEQLKALGEPPATEHKNGNGQAPSFATTATNGPGKDAYVRSAIERECYRVALAPEGERNEALNKAAFALGQFAGWPEMDEREARATLQRAAERAGLQDREILMTIASGWAAGVLNPRPRPVDPTTYNPQANGAVIPGQLVSFGDEIECKDVEWLWQDRIAVGFISIFAGKTGIGKSFVLCDIIARLTTGRPLPGHDKAGPITRVLMISEDPKEYVLVPRLMELKADLKLVAFMTWDAMASYTLGNIDMLETSYQQARQPTLIIVDPPANFLGKKDQHRDAEVRSLVMRLVAWLDTKRVASVFVTHVNKQIGKMVEALDRIMGSVAWGSTARVAIGFSADPNMPTQCLCVGIKSNLGPKASSLIYEIAKTESLAVVNWKGASDISADDAMNQTQKKSRGESAVEWLTEQFRERREWPSEELRTMAIEYGLSKNALWEPEVQALPIMKRQRSTMDGKRYWAWVAKDDWPLPKNERESGNVGTCEDKSLQDNTYNRFPNCEPVGNLRVVREPESDSRNSQIPGGEGSDSRGREPEQPHDTKGVPTSDSQIPESSMSGEESRFPKPEGYPGDWTFYDGTKKGEKPF